MSGSTKLAPWQDVALDPPTAHFAMFGGVGCVRGSTLVETEFGPVRMDQIKAGTRVVALTDEGPVLATCEVPFVKGQEVLYRVVHEAGEFVAHGRHLICAEDGRYQYVERLQVGQRVLRSSLLNSNSEFSQKEFPSGEQHCSQRGEDCRNDYQASDHSCDRPPLLQGGVSQSTSPLQSCEPIYIQNSESAGALASEVKGNHQFESSPHQSRPGSSGQNEDLGVCAVIPQPASPSGPTSPAPQAKPLFQSSSDCRRLSCEHLIGREFLVGPYRLTAGYTTIIKIERLNFAEDYWDVSVPGPQNYIAEGVIHHNTGKSFTGSHFAIKNFTERPEVTGFIGANNYDQLSSATLRELLYWLTEYGYEWVINKIPPESWGKRTHLPTYHNVLSVRTGGRVASAFTRVTSNPDPLRGIEISWYWLDETRDTEEYAHDMILGRCRESDYIRGLITTTTNGESWDYKRFCGSGRDKTLYSSMHVPTIAAVERGILTQQYYNTLRSTYSPMMALQELEAKHVNVFGGKAYYAASERNAQRVAPWGESTPSRDRPLIVGCDFNFSPAPLAWVVGQVGPPIHGPNGEWWGERVHWFGEVSGVGISTVEATLKLIAQYPDFFYEVYGDMSGNVGTTSNAGQTDFDQIGNTLADNNCLHTISVEQMTEEDAHVNPRVRTRVENMNRLFCNALGEVSMTYDPEGCPLFHGDAKMVGWKIATQSGRGRLDDGGDSQRTHATDGAGYAMYKKFPPGRQARIVDSIPSTVREHMAPEESRPYGY